MVEGVDVLDRVGIWVFNQSVLMNGEPLQFPASRILGRSHIPDAASGEIGLLNLYPNGLMWRMPRRIYFAVVDYTFARPTVERLSREACLAVTSVPLAGVSSRDVSETPQPFTVRWTLKRDERYKVLDAVELGLWLRAERLPNFCAFVESEGGGDEYGEGKLPKLRGVYVVRWEARRQGIFLQAALPFLREELKEFWYLVLEITHRRIQPLR